MELNHLRVGSLVLYRTSEGLEPNLIDGVDIETMERSPEYLDDHFPMTLDEVKLRALGFAKENRSTFQYQGLIVTAIENGFGVVVSGRFVDTSFVHLLQNLFFIYHGRELDISPLRDQEATTSTCMEAY